MTRATIQLDRAAAHKQDVDQVLTNVGADARNSSEEFGTDCPFNGATGFSNPSEFFTEAVAARAHCSVEVVRDSTPGRSTLKSATMGK